MFNSGTLRLSIFILLLFCAPLLGVAQQFKPGFIIGTNISEIEGLPTGQYFDNNITKTGLILGPTVRTKINKFLGFELQIRYAQMGMKKNDNSHWKDYKPCKLTLDYIQVPIMANFKIHEDFSVSPGLSFGRLIGLRHKDNEQLIAEPLKSIKNFKKNEFSAFFYFNYEISPLALAFIGTSHSILPINSDAKQNSLVPYRFHKGFYNFTIQLGARLRFTQKKR